MEAARRGRAPGDKNPEQRGAKLGVDGRADSGAARTKHRASRSPVILMSCRQPKNRLGEAGAD